MLCMPLVNKQKHYINLCHIHCTITNINNNRTRQLHKLYSTETQTSLSLAHKARLIYAHQARIIYEPALINVPITS